MLSILGNDAPFEQHDREPYAFRHGIADHPLLGIESLQELVPQFDPKKVYFSMRRMQQGEDFNRAITDGREGASVVELIQGLRSNQGYIMVREPELHPSFTDLHRALTDDIESMLRSRGFAQKAIGVRSYLFISSPDSVTPFHFDRASNFLLQIRGSKALTVFRPWDERVITATEYEAHSAYSDCAVRWKPECEALGSQFHCAPGDAVHIPFLGGHHVRNGSDDLSITLSVFFNTPRTLEQLNALRCNHRLRPLLGRVGLQPAPVGRQRWRDAGKSYLSRVYDRLRPSA